ncbi:MAG TPA: DUF1007 family protein [Spirochaetia bacterium]|nr:DUF1007 family protein [Spirochaetia bacterium]
MKRGRAIFLLAAALTLGPALPALAHPHVFIADRLTINFDKGTLHGISLQWTFDPMFSAMILGDYDPEHTGKFDTRRVAALKQGAFDNLVNYHYFVAIWIGGKPFKKFIIEEFTPSVADKGQLVYRFFIPLDVPLEEKAQTVLLTVYDDTYYVAFDILKLADVTVQAGPDVACNLSIQKTRVKPEWPGQYMPDQLVIRFKESAS